MFTSLLDIGHLVKHTNAVLLGVTCHFIADFKLQSLMLACRRFMGSHTGDEIATLFEEIVESFDLTGKVFYVVTDSAFNMMRAFHLPVLMNQILSMTLTLIKKMK